jgi:predicted Zn-dependent peptidase
MSGYQKTTLPNGLRILTETMPHTRSVSVGFYFGVGSRYESGGDIGAAHFIEHMLFKGTHRRPIPEAVAQEIEGRGGLLNAHTGRESTAYWVKIAASQLPVALDLLCDLVRRPLFDAEELEKERRVIVEEMNMMRDQPDALLSLTIDETCWPDHPLGHDIAGSLESIAAMERTRLLAFWEQTYSPPNLVISVAGKAEHQEVVRQVESLLGDWQGPAAPPYRPAPPEPDAPRMALRSKETEQAHLILRVPGLPRAHPDRFALGLLSTILGDGMSSRLFLELRERRGLAYAVDSSLSYLSDTGVLEAYAALDPANVPIAAAVILREWQRLQEAEVPANEMSRAKEYTRGRLLLGMEDSLSVAGWWGQQELLRDEAMTVDEVIAAVDGVTEEDIRRLANRHFRSRTISIALVGPMDDLGLLDALVEEARRTLGD